MLHKTTSRLRRTAAGAVAALAALTALSACGGSADGSDGDKPVLRVGVQKDGVRAVLKESGLLEDLPYEIEWAEFTAGPPIVEAASADKIDVAWVGSAPPIFGAAADANFKIVAQVQEQDQQENSILVPKGSKITDVTDLEGKKVAVGKGTSAHGLLLQALKRNGLTLDDIEANYLAPADGLAAFTSGEVDAWVVWDPFVTQAIEQNDAVEITGGSPDEQGVQFEIASTKALADPETRENIKHFVGLLQQAWVWALDNSDAWGDGWAAESGLAPEITRVVAKNKAAAFGRVTPETIAAEQALADAFFEAGELPKKIDFAAIVEPGLIE
ncbi:ABC transporter substrate-binding protein [Nocardioides sp. zg-536]|uniref:Putative aliphatic sulfonates-binding protein n=1 Tax=Nocardioides faecalis TaxID=2803858 RepID=A0A939BX99_9ACTN|nr:ABC transporter substrate-binding protein [Nocardioides faecalis]MBM9458590.1 ABC transporter substrate-binding protein [Nocardioides faecalis]QVI58589.1 ABC transporter substrate-binding protein [Nocardioides faecalis]